MQLSIILTTTFLTTTPDLCADVYLDENGEPYTNAIGQTLSRFCEWTGPDAPVLDHDVCCTISGDAAQCALPNLKGRCSAGARYYYCEHGDVTATGAVVCYQPFPSACELGFCGSVAPPNAGPMELTLCCWASNYCTAAETAIEMTACLDGGGFLASCSMGATNPDGSVDCFDE